MGKPVNLNQFRKQKERAEKKARAEENAVKFGRSKVDKQLDRARADKARRDHDSHEIEK